MWKIHVFSRSPLFWSVIGERTGLYPEKEKAARSRTPNGFFAKIAQSENLSLQGASLRTSEKCHNPEINQAQIAKMRKYYLRSSC